jgi:hypothetical protein
MPPVRQYPLTPRHLLEVDVEVVQPNGARALVGTHDAVPVSTGGRAPRVRVCDARITVLPAV